MKLSTTDSSLDLLFGAAYVYADVRLNSSFLRKINVLEETCTIYYTIIRGPSHSNIINSLIE